MTVWQYVCVSCGEIHDAPLRPEGAVFLRCVVTREWAWHQPASFQAAPAPARARQRSVPAGAAKPASRTAGPRSVAARGRAAHAARASNRRSSRSGKKKG